MISVTMGGLSAVSLGFADFIASQNSERIGAARALAGMLLVSSILLSGFMLVQGQFYGLFTPENFWPIILASLHGVTMALALLMFFYAMSVGKISVVAPIIAAHPVVIVGFHASQGTHLSILQIAAVAGILLGVALVGLAGSNHAPANNQTKRYAKWQVVVFTSVAASVIYGIAILFLQQASNGIGDLQVLWFARCIGFITVLSVLVFQGRSPFPPSAKWWGLFTVHGTLDSAGLLFVLLGTNGGTTDTITAVIASAFPVITVALAWVILKERINLVQLIGAAFVFAGVFLTAAV